MITEQEFALVAAATLTRILEVVDEEDPDVVEAIPSDGVVRLDFGGRRPPWVVNSQSAALQIWLAADRRAWHFAHAGDSASDMRWVAEKTGEDLFETLAALLKKYTELDLSF